MKLLTVTFSSCLIGLLLLSTNVNAEKSIKPISPSTIKKAPPPTLVKKCHNKSMSDPMNDYKVASYDPNSRKTPPGYYHTDSGFYCNLVKKYTKPFCRKQYILMNNRCIKSLGTKKLK